MRRLAGRKFRTEMFNVDSAMIAVDVRVTEEGEFLADVDGEELRASTLVGLKNLIQPILLRTRRLEWDPYIQIEFEEGSSRFDNHKDDENRQEITLEFSAGWMTRTKVSGYRNEDHHRWADAEVDPATFEISEPSYEEKRHADTCYSTKDKIPFTPDRWRRLVAIAAALADVRAKLHHILADGTAALLDAVPLTSNLLAAIPEPAPARGRK